MIKRYLPSLLDKLVSRPRGETPRKGNDVSPQEYREAVLEDMRWLLNSSQFPRPERCLTRGPLDLPPLYETDPELVTKKNPLGYRYFHVRNSCYNYGIRGFAGLYYSGLNTRDMAREMKESIQAFEPRITDVEVKVVPPTAKSAPGHLAFTITGRLWCLPSNEKISLRSQMDLETGKCTIT